MKETNEMKKAEKAIVIMGAFMDAATASLNALVESSRDASYSMGQLINALTVWTKEFKSLPWYKRLWYRIKWWNWD